MSVIFLFLDGVGLAAATADNPLADTPMPYVANLLGGPLTIEHLQSRNGLLLAGIDATLGVSGLPQSGTGQTALLAGFNAAAIHGRHQPAFPPVALRQRLAEHNILARVVAYGGQAIFANAFAPSYWQALDTRRLRRPASVIAAQGAGLRFCDLDDLRAGRALSWDVSGAAMQARFGQQVPIISPSQAGANLARLAYDHELVFFECFLPDLAAHGRPPFSIDQALAMVDALIGGTLAAQRPYDTLVICSDHGNIESRAAAAHTRNPVPLLVAGPGAPAFAAVQDIAGVADAILEALDFNDP